MEILVIDCTCKYLYWPINYDICKNNLLVVKYSWTPLSIAFKRIWVRVIYYSVLWYIYKCQGAFAVMFIEYVLTVVGRSLEVGEFILQSPAFRYKELGFVSLPMWRNLHKYCLVLSRLSFWIFMLRSSCCRDEDLTVTGCLNVAHEPLSSVTELLLVNKLTKMFCTIMGVLFT